MIAPTNYGVNRSVTDRDGKPPFKLYRDFDVTCTKKWLVKGLLGDGEASALYGIPGCGKSVLAEDMALHIAAGRVWHGRAVNKGAVLYVALERHQLVERRAIAFRVRHQLDDLPFAIADGVHDFRNCNTTTEFVDRVHQLETVTGERVVLVCIDTLSRALCGGDENSSKDIGALVTATSRLQDSTGAHIMWIHHMPHEGGDRLRGHGALLGALDTTVHVAKSTAHVRTATVVKANDSEEGEKVVFALTSVNLGEETTAPIVVSADAEALPTTQPSSNLSDRLKLGLNVLYETVNKYGQAAQDSLDLPNHVRVVEIKQWREELFRWHILDRGHSNPRQEFKRIWERLAACKSIGLKDGFVWPATAQVSVTAPRV
jgi:hypothetical protein